MAAISRADRLVGRQQGLPVDLTCAAEDFSPLLLPFAKRAAREIGHRLREGVNPRSLPARRWLGLTDTERVVAHLAAQGFSSRAVADRMRLPQPTVRSHLRRCSASWASGPGWSWPRSSGKAPLRAR